MRKLRHFDAIFSCKLLSNQKTMYNNRIKPLPLIYFRATNKLVDLVISSKLTESTSLNSINAPNFAKKCKY